MPTRLLVLVSRGMSSYAIDQVCAHAHASLAEKLGIEAELVDSKQLYQDRFSRCGDWPSWVW